MDPICVHIAVLVIAEGTASADPVARSVTEPAIGAGHRIVERAVVPDTLPAIRDQLTRWMSKREIDVVIVTSAVESDHAGKAFAPLVTEPLPGFTDLFRYLAFQAIGAAAMLSNAEAARCGDTIVFVLPASVEAVRMAMDKLILPQLDRRTKPRNLVGMMPRFHDTVVDAIPAPVVNEKTAAGAGPPPRLPAVRTRAKTGRNVIAKKDPFASDQTKPIDLDRLEEQIALSSDRDQADPTKPNKADPPPPPGARNGRSVRAESEPIPPPPPPGRKSTPAVAAEPTSEASDEPPRSVAEARRTRPQPTVRVYPEPTSKRHRIIIATLATVFVGFVIAIAWELMSSGTGDSNSGERTAAIVPPTPAQPPAPPPPPPPPAADAAIEIDAAPAEIAVELPDAAVPVKPPEHHHHEHHVAQTPPPPPPAAPSPDAGVVASTSPPPPPPPAGSDAAGCDEVSCVMSKYADPCCAKYKPKEDFHPTVPPQTTEVPDELTRDMVKAAVARVKPRVAACGDRSKVRGTVKVSVSVNGDGAVSSINVDDTPDPDLGACVAAAMKAASFGKSKSGGSFTYPFVF